MKILLEIPDEMGALVDEARGLVPRVTWIRAAIADHLDMAIGTTVAPERVPVEPLANTSELLRGAKREDPPMPEKADPPGDKLDEARNKLASITAHPSSKRPTHPHADNCPCFICKPLKGKK